GHGRSMLTAQNMLELKDVPMGISIIMSPQTIGGAPSISIAQNVSTNNFVSGLLANVSGVSAPLVLSAGALSLADAVAPEFLSGVLHAYNEVCSVASPRP
ncbi:hypothetical protein K438DRAFT_1618556, partial [Mycena galopus ATCC 62051]